MEVNFDGLVGPTHHYAGLSYGNVASLKSQSDASNPKEAALQGLRKMKFMADLGLKQAVLPPQQRPDLRLLRRVGFDGSDSEILSKLGKAIKSQGAKGATMAELLSAASSASSMWTANAATVAPSVDTADKRLHITPASLATKLHRSIEAETTKAFFDKIFSDARYFTVHDPLPVSDYFGDEGAANHTRLGRHDAPGVHIFVFGRWAGRDALKTASKTGRNVPVKFPARQTFEASQSVSRLHRLSDSEVIFVQQNPRAIDVGAFHNDVVSVGNENVLLYHEGAFADSKAALAEIRKKFRKQTSENLVELCVRQKQVPLKTAVATYLFNSQLVTLPSGPPGPSGSRMALIAPVESEENRSVRKALDAVMDHPKSPISEVHFLDLRQSMKNGGGPACLRLRVPMNQVEFNAIHQGVVLTNGLYSNLVQWVERHYRDRLTAKDLLDPALLTEGLTALDELTRILKIGEVYPFQR